MPSWNWNIHSPFIMTLALGLTLKDILKYKLRWAIPVKKNEQGSDWGHTYLKNLPESFEIFLLYSLEIPNKTKVHPCKFHKIVLPICVTSLENSEAKIRNPYKFHMLFLWYPWKFRVFNPHPPVFFFRTAH